MAAVSKQTGSVRKAADSVSIDPFRDEVAPELAPVRRGEDLDWGRIGEYLRANLPAELDVGGGFEVLQFPNGAANLTYLIRFGELELVLRRPPFGTLAPGAHDMKREYKVLGTLWRHFDRAPRAFLLCDDPAVAGADFFVMERRHGEVIRGVIPENMREHPDVGRRIGIALVEAMADFHLLDPIECGLSDLGRPAGFVERQVRGWKKRWDLVADPDHDAAMSAVHARLEECIPATQRVSLVHNDLKLDNCMFDPADPDRVIAFFDWDMTTLGDPLIDLGTLLNYWPDPADGHGTRGSQGGLDRMGLPSRAEVRKPTRSGPVWMCPEPAGTRPSRSGRPRPSWSSSTTAGRWATVLTRGWRPSRRASPRLRRLRRGCSTSSPELRRSQMVQRLGDIGAWHRQVEEEIIDPERPIVDPHHHLWRDRGVLPQYLLEELWADTDSGHNIVETVFLECRAEYRRDGPEHLRPLGETEFVADQAAQSAKGGPGKARIAAIVAHADLQLGDRVDEVLALHHEAGRGLFRGIRHSGARDEDPEALMIPGRAPEGLYQDAAFQSGMKRLGQLGFTYDTWHYHHQNPSFASLARAVPDTTMVLDHFGTPLGVGRFAGRRAEIFEVWKKDVAQVAECPNVIAKLGGLAMPDNGFGWMGRNLPPCSDEFVKAQAPYYLHMIDCFTPDRCMFESNFPVDRLSISYPVLWNGFKKIVQSFSEDEKDAMFRGTASRVYRL